VLRRLKFMERMKPRSYDELKARITDIIKEVTKAFPEGKYWLLLDENSEGVEEEDIDVEDKDGNITTRAMLVFRDHGVITKESIGKYTSLSKDHFNATGMKVLESEIPDVIKIIREDGHLYKEEGHDDEIDGEGGNLDYWQFFE
jgi:hypothetical protein